MHDENDDSSPHMRKSTKSIPSFAEMRENMANCQENPDSLEENSGAPSEERARLRHVEWFSQGHLRSNEECPTMKKSYTVRDLGVSSSPIDDNENEATPKSKEWLHWNKAFNQVLNRGTPFELPPTDASISRECPGTPLVSWRKTTFQELQPGGSIPAIFNESDGEEDVDEIHSVQISSHRTEVNSRPSNDSIERKYDHHKILHSKSHPQRIPAEKETESLTLPPSTTNRNATSSVLHRGNSLTLGTSLKLKTPTAIKTLLSQRKGHRKMFDSYDYQIVDSTVWHDRERKETPYLSCLGLKSCYAPEVMTRINFGNDARMAIILLGILVSLGSIAVSECTDLLLTSKFHYLLSMVEQYQGDEKLWGFGRAFLVNVIISCAFACVAFSFVVLSPASQGSGLAEVKTILNGVHLEKITSLWTAIAKCSGVVFAVSSGLPVGIEGPMIHLGLVLGAQVSQVKSVLRTDRHRRDFAACGTAAGVAAAFHTPIGGVLFALEEGASFWSTLLTWRAFACAIVTMITVYFVYGVKKHTVPTDVFNVIGNGVEQEHFPRFSILQLPIFAFIGGIGGCLGAVWIILNTKLSSWRRRLKIGGRFAEIMLIVISMSALTWWLSYYKGACIDVPANVTTRFFQNIKRYNCE